MGKLKASEAPTHLWVIAGKLRCIGEVVSMCFGVGPFSDEGIAGLAHLFLQFADDIDAVRDSLEAV